ncbi:MAG: formylglycine-generating enzyme family protein [Treponema sp.]|nr:formylglycine-generating enzyme family protein [Treponema sp.]
MMEKRTLAALAAMTLLALAISACATAPAHAPDDGFVWVPGGTFQMGIEGGGHLGVDGPVRTVTVSGFYMSRFPVTQGQWYDVMGDRPSWFDGTRDWDDNPVTGVNWRNLPVEQVSWLDAVQFANRLSVQNGRTPAYTIAGTQVTWNRNADGYRLPTEAEWEFAARGGHGSPGNYAFSGGNVASEVAWYYGNSGRRTHEVGRLRPNALGLYDMSGNVWEWVYDWFGTYPNHAETDPSGASVGAVRVFRGGGLFDSAVGLGSSFRGRGEPSFRISDLGFRLVRP